MQWVNPWHHVSCGSAAPAVVQSIIEIPAGSKAKYELDKASGLLRLDRVLFSSVHYPANYGFIPQTYCDDGDPLDILVLSQIAFAPLCIVEAKVFGALQMMDQGQHDDKIIAVAAQDMSVAHFDDIHDVPAHFLLGGASSRTTNGSNRKRCLLTSFRDTWQPATLSRTASHSISKPFEADSQHREKIWTATCTTPALMERRCAGLCASWRC